MDFILSFASTVLHITERETELMVELPILTNWKINNESMNNIIKFLVHSGAVKRHAPKILSYV